MTTNVKKLKNGGTFTWEPPVRETEEMAQRFSALMAGQSFSQNVRTKTYGTQPRPSATLIPTQSGLAACG